MDTHAVLMRMATEEDLDQIVYMLADDELGKTRERYEQPLPETYRKAFHSIDSDPNNELVVACIGEEVVGVLQITFIPYLTHQGGWRATIEGVRTATSVRGKGVGSQLIRWVIERAKERGCHLLQLTTDKKRENALHFYERLGFKATHEGMKMKLYIT
ncbi:GNAT family N-acetyltransferase [Ammoniphilus sp. CFH 90114]|uniref:GNAT family N-acetyltransferase n=1 Tax=Ammoniphilus sp. CFH 90114 TaxID=2493665 RepID=UPI00100E718B|nr:GNAT family N-acetyltransferase [Ammoniphilus sp. CFH 90114]RXT03798.1 GNAT family N-acetyltransferase [Ammoniphilus sp. CFH 90114]